MVSTVGAPSSPPLGLNQRTIGPSRPPGNTSSGERIIGTFRNERGILNPRDGHDDASTWKQQELEMLTESLTQE